MSHSNATHSLCLIEQSAPAGAHGPIQLGACNRAIYVIEGALQIDGETLAADHATISPIAITISVSDQGARWLRWELLTRSEPESLAHDDGITSMLKTIDAITTTQVQADWFMRCDSVSFPPGGCALTHTHKGPGIRYLLDGTIRIDTLGESTDYDVGGAWYESGPHPVFAQADTALNTRFVRAMVLPPELAGKSSITYVNADDLDKPKSQSYHRYCEQNLAL
ncbi:MAG: hypothetical protein ACI9DC_002821 [Gammaproteobacteria bacterium]|jgi:hypothetical protein